MNLLKRIAEARRAEKRYLSIRDEFYPHAVYETDLFERYRLAEEYFREAVIASDEAIKLRDSLPIWVRWTARFGL